MSGSRNAKAEQSGLRRYIPALAWLPEYQREWLSRDTMAGLTVWALVVPESMAYAAIAGVPVQYGLYSVPLALLGYAIFGGSRHLFVGPSATVASISAVAVGSVAVGGDPSSFIAMTAALALMTGVLYLICGFVRLGFVARFFASPVLDGFIIGLGVYIAVGQFPKLVGIEKPAGDTVAIFLKTIGEIGSWNTTTVVVGALALGALFAIAHYWPKLPGALIVVVASILAVRAFDLGSHGVALVGNIPTGFSFVSWSSVTADDLYHLVPGALAILIVGFAQSVAIAKVYAAQERKRLDANQEMIGYGAANIGAGALQGFTVTGSLSKSAAAEEAGGRTPLLLAVTAVLTLLTILVLAGLFEKLPETVLAAVVIHAVWGMLDFSKLARLWRAHIGEFAPAIGAFAGVVVIGILPGVLIGVALSFMLLIHRLDHPHIATLGRRSDGRAFGEVGDDEDVTEVPGVLVLAFDAPLIFANAEIFTDEITERINVAEPPPHTLVLDCEAMANIDTTGSQALRGLVDSLSEQGIDLALARVCAPVREFLRRDGTAAVVGEDAIFLTIRDAVPAADSSY